MAKVVIPLTGTSLVRSPAFVAELVATPAGHVVAAQCFLDPKPAFAALFELLAFGKGLEVRVFGLI